MSRQSRPLKRTHAKDAALTRFHKMHYAKNEPLSFFLFTIGAREAGRRARLAVGATPGPHSLNHCSDRVNRIPAPGLKANALARWLTSFGALSA
jgi:hypothetical protein